MSNLIDRNNKQKILFLHINLLKRCRLYVSKENSNKKFFIRYCAYKQWIQIKNYLTVTLKYLVGIISEHEDKIYRRQLLEIIDKSVKANVVERIGNGQFK